MGQILSGIMQSYDSYRTNSAMLKASSKARKWQDDLIRNAIKIRVEDAKRAGINPLFALGINPATGSVAMPSLDSNNRGLENMGQGIEDLVTRITDKRGKEIQDLELEMKRLERDKMQLENVGLKNEIDKAKQTKIVPVGDDPISKFANIPGQPNQASCMGCDYTEPALPGQGAAFIRTPSEVPYQSKFGVEAGTVPLYRYATDPDGGVRVVFSKPMEEAVESDKHTELLIFAEKTLRHIASIGHHIGNIRSKNAIKARNILRKYRPEAEGYEFKYDPAWNKFYPVKKRKGNSGFYLKNNRGIPYNEELPGKVVKY